MMDTISRSSNSMNNTATRSASRSTSGNPIKPGQAGKPGKDDEIEATPGFSGKKSKSGETDDAFAGQLMQANAAQAQGQPKAGAFGMTGALGATDRGGTEATGTPSKPSTASKGGQAESTAPAVLGSEEARGAPVLLQRGTGTPERTLINQKLANSPNTGTAMAGLKSSGRDGAFEEGMDPSVTARSALGTDPAAAPSENVLTGATGATAQGKAAQPLGTAGGAMRGNPLSLRQSRGEAGMMGTTGLMEFQTQGIPLAAERSPSMANSEMALDGKGGMDGMDIGMRFSDRAMSARAAGADASVNGELLIGSGFPGTAAVMSANPESLRLQRTPLSGGEFLSTLSAVQAQTQAGPLAGPMPRSDLGSERGFSGDGSPGRPLYSVGEFNSPTTHTVDPSFGHAIRAKKLGNGLGGDELGMAQSGQGSEAASGVMANGSKPFAAAAATVVTGHVTQGAMTKERLSSESLIGISTGIRNLTTQGGGEIHLKLHPENLGELHLKVVTDGKQVGLQIQASDDRARKILEESISHLQDSLGSHQMSLKSVEFTVAQAGAAENRDPNSQQHQQQQQQHNGQWNPDQQGFQDLASGGRDPRGQGFASQEGGGRFGSGSFQGGRSGISSGGAFGSRSQAAAVNGRLDVMA
jgi:hypothetical protein